MNIKCKHAVGIVVLLIAAVFASSFSVHAHAADDRLEAALQIAVDIASDNTHGYANRTRMGDPDFDCASFVCSAFYRAGFDVYPWNNVGSMIGDFTKKGFEYISGIDFYDRSQLRRGDVLLKDGHTEIYLGDGLMVGAHVDYDGRPGDSANNEINVRSFYVRGYDGTRWTGVLRYTGPEPAEEPAEEPIKEPAEGSAAALLCGDVNLDGAITSFDARLVLRAAIGLEPISPDSELFPLADVDSNGKIDAGDARSVLRASVGLQDLDKV